MVGPGRRLLYSALHFSSDVWALPIDPDQAQPLGKLKPLTNDHVRVQLPGVSFNGSKLVYVSDRSGVRDVWVGDANGAREQAVTSFRQIGYRPLLSPDGRLVVYPAVVGGKCAVLIEDLRGRHVTRSLEGCYSVWDWSPDGSSLLTFETGKPTSVDVRNIVAGTRTLALSHPTQALFSARFSPDGKWIAFTSGLSSPQARVYIAPFNGRYAIRGRLDHGERRPKRRRASLVAGWESAVLPLEAGWLPLHLGAEAELGEEAGGRAHRDSTSPRQRLRNVFPEGRRIRHGRHQGPVDSESGKG